MEIGGGSTIRSLQGAGMAVLMMCGLWELRQPLPPVPELWGINQRSIPRNSMKDKREGKLIICFLFISPDSIFRQRQFRTQ